MDSMQKYLPAAATCMEQALNRMPMPAPLSRLPARQDIARYMQHLLLPKEQAACDMATD